MKQLLASIYNFYQRIKYRKKSIIIDKKVKMRGETLEGHNKLYEGTQFISSGLGKGSYVGPNCYFINTTIGRYCSIGPKVKTVLGRHPSSVFATTHPAFFSLRKQSGFTYSKKQRFCEFKYADEKNETSIIIGNDVWVGSDVLIMEGVIINDGAIIAAGSVVTKNVEPYAIVCGVPAKEIKKRFKDEEINFLLNLKWWHKDETWLTEHVSLFENVKYLIEKFK